MPPRSGQLDEISLTLGELRAAVEGIEKYMHRREHGINNLAQKVDGLALRLSGDLAAAKAEINVSLATAIEKVEARIQIIDERVVALERADARQTGAKGVIVWLLQSPVIGWIVAGALAFVAWWKGVPR